MEAAFFDLDKTVIARSSVLAYGKPLYREGLLSRSGLLKSIYGHAVYRLGGASPPHGPGPGRHARPHPGLEQARVAGVVRDTYQSVVAPIIYAEALALFDTPLLEAVGHPVAVNPDRELTRVARRRGWEIRRFEHPVRFHPRVPVPPSAPTAAVGGLAALGLAGWLRHRSRGP